MKKLLILLTTTLWACQAGDTNWPHYGYYKVLTHPEWTEALHRVKWHDGFYGPELVRVELTTNVVIRLGGHPPNGWSATITNRIVNVIAGGYTNEVQVGELGRSYNMVAPTLPPWCCTNNGWVQVPIIYQPYQLTNVVYAFYGWPSNYFGYFVTNSTIITQ